MAIHDVALIDENAIRQVITNLLRNAIEALSANERDRHVEIRTCDSDAGIRLEVEDNGLGIRPNIRDSLFEPFASSGKPGGIGLGLAICRDIVGAHGGSISAHGGKERGCVIRVVLPP